jgi:hypothetical protein
MNEKDPTMSKTVDLATGAAGRLLADNELDSVNGGIINGCIRYPNVLPMLPPTGPGYVDPFASILPSWVHPL